MLAESTFQGKARLRKMILNLSVSLKWVRSICSTFMFSCHPAEMGTFQNMAMHQNLTISASFYRSECLGSASIMDNEACDPNAPLRSPSIQK